MSVTDDQQFCLRWNNFQTYITSQFETLRDDEDFVDVTLACDGQRLGAHKVVLSACSPFFKELFKTNPCRHPIVFMRDVEVRHIVALLEFMYAGEVNVAQTHLAGFLRTAESLQIRGLTDAANTKKDNENQIEAQPTSTQLPISPTPPTKPLKSKTPSTTSILKSRISPSRTVTSSQEKSPDSPEPPRKKPKDDETVDPNPIDTTTLALRTDLDNSSPELTKSELTQINPFAVETTKLLHSEIDITTDLIEPKLELLDYSEDDLTNPDDKNFLDADQHNSFANLSGGMEIIPGTSGMGDVSQESEQAWDNRKLHSLDPRPCPVCARVYSNLSNLRQHMRLIHNPTHVVCPSCSKSFKTTLYLKRHLVACRGTGQTKKPDAAKLNITTRSKSCADECQNSPAEPTEFIGTRSMLKRAEDSYLLADQTELAGRERDFYQSNSPFSKTEPPKLVRIAPTGPKTAAENADYFHDDDFFESPANCFENTLTYVSDDAIPNITV